ncbi:MAG: type 2 isopentenyl-diphosphate Delta-isomerase [Acidilobaceae archaeon]
MMGNTSSRKLEHVKLSVDKDVESKGSSLLEYVRLIHNPLPELDLEDVDLTVDVCNADKKIKAPIIIAGMTGGHPDVAWINEALARVAEEFGIAVGVGSQRAAIEDPSLESTFRIAREAAPNAFIIANIGGAQLVKGYGLKELRRAIDMIKADALAIHLNPAQEAFQPEGEPAYRRLLEKLVEIADRIEVPLIIKETGSGLRKETVGELYRLGFKCFDVQGRGGTSWIKVEHYRRGKGDMEIADEWGNPTAVAIVETRVAAPKAYVIGSGGIRSSLDIAKSIALGANAVAIARPLLKALFEGGYEGLREKMREFLEELRILVFLTGSRNVKDLWRAPLTLSGRLREELEFRNINVEEYLRRGRLLPLLKV